MKNYKSLFDDVKIFSMFLALIMLIIVFIYALYRIDQQMERDVIKSIVEQSKRSEQTGELKKAQSEIKEEKSLYDVNNPLSPIAPMNPLNPWSPVNPVGFTNPTSPNNPSSPLSPMNPNNMVK